MPQFYAAGSSVAIQGDQSIIRHPMVTHVMLSYAYERKALAKLASVMEQCDKKMHLFLDCGAFTAWTKGTKLDLKDYIAFCKEWDWMIEWVSAMDEIPGKFGTVPTKKQTGESAGKTLENYKRLLDAGLPKEKLVPAIHRYETAEDLDRLLELKPTRVGIGGIARIPQTTAISFALSLLPAALDGDGKPRTSFHCYGRDDMALLKVFPWASCDGATWIHAGSVGCIEWKNRRGGFSRLNLTGAKKISHGLRLEELTEEQRRGLLSKCKHYGISLEQLEAHYYYRWLFCLLQEAEAAQSINSLKTFQAPKVASFF
jgi:hypothetical protein